MMCIAAGCLCDVCSYLFHYIAENGVIYLCVTDDVSCLMFYLIITIIKTMFLMLSSLQKHFIQLI